MARASAGAPPSWSIATIAAPFFMSTVDLIETHNWAMRETTPTFLDTAIFFTLSVAIGIDATGFSRRITNYEIRVLAYVSVLVASPLYTVLALSLGTLRRNLTSLVVILLCIGVAAPAFTVNSGGDRWGSICFSDTIMFMIARTTMASFFGAIFLACELCRLLLGPIQRATQGSRREFLKQMPQEQPWGRQADRSCWQSVPSFSKRYIYNWTQHKGPIWAVATFSLIFTLTAAGHLAIERGRMQSLAGQVTRNRR